MIVELKWNKNAEGAIKQIKSRNYPKVLTNYGGKIVLVDVNYDENTKSVLDLTDDRKFVIYLDNNGPSEARVEGRYRVYKGEEAINKIASMPEYGSMLISKNAI